MITSQLKIALVGVAFSLNACIVTSPEYSPEESAGVQRSLEVEPPAPVAEPVYEPRLYARDGNPVQVAQGSMPLQEPEARIKNDGSRMYLLELYQDAVDQKETLGVEVNQLNLEIQSLRDALTAKDQELGAQRETFHELEEANAGLQKEIDELMGRVVTAQIRRLQAERLLLESKIVAARSAAQTDNENRESAEANNQ